MITVDTIEHYGKTYTLIFGVFFNRPGIHDGTIGNTSQIKSISINYEQKEYLIQTKNTLYHCSFDSCFFERQDESKITLSDYEKIKAEFYKPIDTQTLSKNDMLLVLSDLCEYRQTIDIRWYVNDGGIEFYSLDIGRRNFFIENRGKASLTIVDDLSTIEILQLILFSFCLSSWKLIFPRYWLTKISPRHHKGKNTPFALRLPKKQYIFA